MSKDKKRLVPVRRFKEFENAPAWEQRKFSEILAKSDGLRRGPFGSALKKEFFISSSEYTVYEQNNAIYNTWKTRYFITPEKFQELHKFQLVPGDFILSGAGTIGRIAQVPANITKGVFNQALIRIRINPEWMDKNFFLIWMQSENMQRKLTQANPGSAMTNLVPMSEIKKWEIIIPSKAEQNKIGEFIQKINSLIALHQRKLDKLKRVKSAYLTEMFPAEGEREPKRRFPGFTVAWEQRKLGEVVEITMGQSPSSKNYTENPNDHILVQGNADMKNGHVVPRVWTTQITKQAEKGDLILSVRAPVGDIGKTDYDVVLGRGVAAIKGNSFIFQLLTKMKINGYWTRFSTGSTFESINSDNIKNAQISIPSLREQEKIGGLFNEFDSLIALHQRKLDKLKKMKAAYLEEMFV
ncbi:restriction endonuclease subunit S [Limosilactobacillus reuteri]|uniref:restriction endonuclease subunit S n=1 Tax=Limosilactobacillus reuteri TaxID=1598 RepID=UPI0015DFF7CE|nr:restriction endonuclease subunit S [Limosilactobacillus reuteri]QLL76528.1 restriction endonuclease subunit S [Limosilactobacillus reuteri]